MLGGYTQMFYFLVVNLKHLTLIWVDHGFIVLWKNCLKFTLSNACHKLIALNIALKFAMIGFENIDIEDSYSVKSPEILNN